MHLKQSKNAIKVKIEEKLFIDKFTKINHK